jgi:hypothetical protein
MYIYISIATWSFPYKSLGLYDLSTALTDPTHVVNSFVEPIFIRKTLFKSYYSHKSKPTALIPAVAEPPELFRLKCASHRYSADTDSTHFKRNNPLLCRVSAQYNHSSTGSNQVYLARRRVYNYSTAHQLLTYRNANIITNLFQT